MFKYAAIFLLSITCALLCTPLVQVCAARMRVLDVPGERRIHTVPVPRLGGVAVFFALIFAFSACALSDRYLHNILFGHGPRLAGLVAASAVVVLLGALDDAFSLNPALKLAGQVLAALILMLVGAGINFIGGVRLGIFGPALTLLWLLAVTNAFNLIDGLDGLAAGVGAIVSATLFAIFVWLGEVANAMLMAALCGALLGFLRYNFHPARIFLGDSGALLIGFMLAAVSMDTGNRPPAIVAILMPILALGMPLAETGLTVIRRLLRTVHAAGYNPQTRRYEFLVAGKAALFTADRQHIHHRLLDFGFSQRNAVLLLYGISLALGSAAFGIVIYRQINLALLLAAFGVVSVLGIQRLNYSELHLIRKGVLLALLDATVISSRRLKVFADLVFIVASYFVAVVIASGGNLSHEAKASFLQSAPLLTLVQIVALALSGLYRPSYRNGGIGDLLASVKSVLIAITTSWLIVLLVRGSAHFSINRAILDGYLLLTMVIGGRLSFRALEYVFKAQSTGRRRALIYGTGAVGLSALHEIRNNSQLDLLVVGFIDSRLRSRARTLDGLPILDSVVLEDLITNRQVDEVVVATTHLSTQELEHLRKTCRNCGVAIRRFSIGWNDVLPPLPSFANADTAAD